MGFFRNNTVKSILDVQQKPKAKETAEERQKRIINNKLQTALFKQKETLKKDIQKKRALMEKALSAEIQV